MFIKDERDGRFYEIKPKKARSRVQAKTGELGSFA